VSERAEISEAFGARKGERRDGGEGRYIHTSETSTAKKAHS